MTVSARLAVVVYVGFSVVFSTSSAHDGNAGPAAVDSHGSHRSLAKVGLGEVMRDDDPPMLIKPGPTVDGCTCNADCGARIVDSFECDRCSVEGPACGKHTFLGHRYDYCVYPKVVAYEAQNGSQKLRQLWKQITAKDVVNKSTDSLSVISALKGAVGVSMRTTFDNNWDVMPPGRTKVIHTQGVHCMIELDVAAESPFTGLLAPGVSTGIIRMGSALSLDGSGLPPFPGLSFKFLRSGVHSGNFVALRASGLQFGGGYRFFDEEFSTIVDPPGALRALMKFEQASGCTSTVGLSNLCSFAQDGFPATNVTFPFDILFEASSDAVFLPDVKMSDAEMLGYLSAIEAGTHLFNVYAKAEPRVAKVRLGTLKTVSKCVKSVFGDDSLFFKHQRMEEDFAKRPDWTKLGEILPSCTFEQSILPFQCPGIGIHQGPTTNATPPPTAKTTTTTSTSETEEPTSGATTSTSVGAYQPLDLSRATGLGLSIFLVLPLFLLCLGMQ